MSSQMNQRVRLAGFAIHIIWHLLFLLHRYSKGLSALQSEHN